MKRLKVVFLAQVIVALTLVLLVSAFIKYQNFKDNLHQELLVNVQNTSQRMSISLPKAVWDFDLDTAKVAMAAELDLAEISAIQLIDAQESELLFLTQTGEGDEKQLVDVTNKDAYLAENSMSTELTFVDYGEENKVGKVVVYFDTHAMDAKLADSLRTNIIELIVLDIIISIVIIIVLSMTVLRPISELTDVIKDLASGDGDLTNKLAPAKYREFDEITNGINSLSLIHI